MFNKPKHTFGLPTSAAARPKAQGREATARSTAPIYEEGIPQAIQHVKDSISQPIDYESAFQVQYLGDPIDVENRLREVGWVPTISNTGVQGHRRIANQYTHWGHEGIVLTHSYTRPPLFTDPLKSENKSVLSFTQTGTSSGY